MTNIAAAAAVAQCPSIDERGYRHHMMWTGYVEQIKCLGHVTVECPESHDSSLAVVFKDGSSVRIDNPAQAEFCGQVTDTTPPDAPTIPVWVGWSSGGYGNGPYDREFQVDTIQPLNEIIDDSPPSPVIRTWRQAVDTDFSRLSDVSAAAR